MFSTSFTVSFVVGVLFFSRGSSWDLQWVIRHVSLRSEKSTRKKSLDLHQMYKDFEKFERDETRS